VQSVAVDLIHSKGCQRSPHREAGPGSVESTDGARENFQLVPFNGEGRCSEARVGPIASSKPRTRIGDSSLNRMYTVYSNY